MAPLTVKPFIALMAISALADVAFGANYTIGAPAGLWDLSTNYTQWVKGLKFFPGDFLIFNYSQLHNVREVPKYGYTWCSAAEAIIADDSGTTVVELTSNGTRYFICTIGMHCLKGMKLQIDVLQNSTVFTPPPPPPAPATRSSPNNAAAAQIGIGTFANFVLGLIGLMLMVF